MKYPLFFFAILFTACIQDLRETPEFINAPNTLAATRIATSTYRLNFYADNREGGFSGYGIFVAASDAALDTYPSSNDITAPAGYCQLSSQAEYKRTVAIQVGPEAVAIVDDPPTICNITALTLTSGTYVGVRARVERLTNVWSAPAKVLLP